MAIMTMSRVPWLKAWLIFFGISTAAITVTGAILSGVAAPILVSAGYRMQDIAAIIGIGNVLVSAPISLLVFRFCVVRFIVEPLLGSPPGAGEQDE
jgi:hypothetical protein